VVIYAETEWSKLSRKLL